MGDDEEEERKPKKNPYKDWLNGLPYKPKERAFKESQHYNRNKTVGESFGDMFFFGVFYFFFIMCLNVVIRNQKKLED